ncbi:toprim domain-containing protein [Salinilacihabitans rarus]|uniref:toprim domain-containing protein n=1 Tax=Salinilacihabitans rarus TaxID=2961596 RepID=UPI0020C8E627|nr:toprim domain-containing protein [Salinilacihabitans rarus]
MSGQDDDAASPPSIDELVEALPDLQAYIENPAHGQHTTDLVAVGDEYRGAHPVHGSTNADESGPAAGNFAVNPAKGVWYCHRCGAGGDLLNYIAVDEGLVDCAHADDLADVFPLVLDLATEAAGIADRMSGADRRELAARRHERAAITEVHTAACTFYRQHLDEPRPDEPTETWAAYVRNRWGLSAAILDEAGIGYAPREPRALVDYLRAEGFEDHLLRQSGLVSENDEGELVDYFDGRLIFPYRVRGAPRYFIGRRTPQTPGRTPSKYRKLRNPDPDGTGPTACVTEPVFGLDTARSAEHVVVTEGVTDALALHDAGFAAIAPVGTAFGEDRLKTAARALSGKRVTVVMDEDEVSGAGLRAALTTATDLAETGHPREVRVGRLTAADGVTQQTIDVAEFYRDYDAAAFAQVLDAALPVNHARYCWGETAGDPSYLFAAAVEAADHDPTAVASRTDDEGTESLLGVDDIIDGDELPTAQREFHRRSDLSGKDVRDIFEHAIRIDLEANGSFIRSDDGRLWYFFDPEHRLYPIDASGQQEIHDEFHGLIKARFGLSMDQWSRGLFKDIRIHGRRIAARRAVHQFACYNAEAGELYVSDFDDGYYVVDGSDEAPEHRPNGTDVLFRDERGEPWTYVPPAARPEPDGDIPGERSPWAGEGDLLHRYVTNRVNFGDAVLTPAQQRLQLYLHLHIIPLTSLLSARPILAWVGPKGSGKTVTQRMIGRLFYGPSFKETVMPDEKKDFYAVLANRPLTFIDNYDDGRRWANDVLAAVATGAKLELRKLYSTVDLASYDPQCWLSLTSRDPPFRRDDVAERMLVFNLERIATGTADFVGTTPFLEVVDEAREPLLSALLDNVNAVLRVYHDTERAALRSQHRMADWAACAHLCAEALDLDGVDALLEAMGGERAAFVLEDDPLRPALDHYLETQPKCATRFHSTTKLYDVLAEAAASTDHTFDYADARHLGRRLKKIREELHQLYGMEVDTSGRAPQYRFPTARDDE